MTTLFYACTDARTNLISLQLDSIRTFCPASDLVVVNNAVPSAIRDLISSETRRLGARLEEVPPPLQVRITPNDAHASALCWLWPEIVMRDRPDYAVLIDFDMFCVKPFDIATYMGDALIAGVPQSRPIGPEPEAHYFWPGLLMFHLAALPEPETINLGCGMVDGVNVDVAGQLHHYLVKHCPRTREVSATKSMMCHARLTHADGIEKLPPEARSSYSDEYRCDVLADGAFLHYTGGTGWDHPAPDLVHWKTTWVQKLVTNCISGEWRMP